MFAENVYLARRIGGEPAQVVGGGPIAGLVEKILAMPEVFVLSSIGYAGVRADSIRIGISDLTRDKVKQLEDPGYAGLAQRIVLAGHELVLTERQGENLFIWDMHEGVQKNKSAAVDMYLDDLFKQQLELEQW